MRLAIVDCRPKLVDESLCLLIADIDLGRDRHRHGLDRKLLQLLQELFFEVWSRLKHKGSEVDVDGPTLLIMNHTLN